MNDSKSEMYNQIENPLMNLVCRSSVSNGYIIVTILYPIMYIMYRTVSVHIFLNLFQITATEVKDPTHSSTLTVTITLLPVNDNIPKFTEDIYKVAIDEPTEERTDLMLTVEAIDADKSPDENIIVYVSHIYVIL